MMSTATPFSPPAVLQVVQNPNRLAVLNYLELLDTPAEEAFDRLTRLASLIVGAPVSLVSLVDADRQFFKSFIGLPEPYASQRETPLSHSFCQHVVATNSPLIVEDARQHPVVLNNLAIRDLGVIAYLGIPLQTTDGYGLGSFCVIDSKPRVWQPHEIEIVRELALSVMVEIELRGQLKARLHAEHELQRRNMQLERVTELSRSTLDHMHEAIQHGAPKDEVQQYLQSARHELNRLV